eukprot:TRINITY_DN40548_c0_g1_i1.p1 TRINITY_DN40548_c0_g1~~TRINITY_DN40548_c0_g1_i1.p1  ORF type:complete len:357 (+),score=46.09 TRINITY_DN40548_c0_g1_i1:71-1141(+)
MAEPECCVCLGSIQDCCRAKCGHTFCRQCILKVLGMKPPEWHGVCPMCRAHTSIYSLRDASGNCLATTEINSLYGCIFVQASKMGLASYHFDSPDDCYISYENAPAEWTLDDGSRLPPKKPWVNYSYDAETLTFRGIIEWDIPLKKMDRWDYEIVFSEDFSGVVGGRVLMRFTDGQTSSHKFSPPWEVGYHRALAYLRWTPPPATVFGSIFVQSYIYSPLLEGVASYHFDAEDDCYISYSRAPAEWVLADGNPPPAKKPFSEITYDADARVFRGVIEWDPPFDGASRWEYEMIFAEDFGSIIDGQMLSYDTNGVCNPGVKFLNPDNGDGEGLLYTRKPSVLSDGARAIHDLVARSE